MIVMFESLSHFDKIRVSKDVEPETVKGRLDSFADEAEKNEEEYKIHEVEPNEIEKQIIEDVLFGLEVMLIRVYGIEDVKEINPTKIHLVSAGALKEFGGGVHLGSTGSVYVENLESFFGSKISFASTLAHELLHFFSYKEGQLGVDQFHISRRGLDLSAEDVQEFRRYFNYIDEAVTAHFTMRFREMEMLAGRHGEYK
ncbi:MAG: hypothetical protein NTV48_03680 [Candidatus Vogelbacteria bacterium]|nr:hypothetical protein [Candidatus Vogelbacteria bacterium]